MRYKVWYIVPILLVLLSMPVACGGGGNGVSQAPKPTGTNTTTQQIPENVAVDVHNITDNDTYYNYAISNITMPSSRVLTCIRIDSADDSPVSLSCNWPDYNRRVR